MNKHVLFVLVFYIFYVPIWANNPSKVFVIINIPDANFKQALINLGVDTNGNSEIDDFEAVLVGGLNLNNQNISDLTGIEAFLNITFLDVSDNNLSAIDLSLNDKISILYCANNNLSALDVSHLMLAELRCRDNNISSLDLNLSTTLTHLYCQNNALTSLDVRNNVDLQYFSCRNNQLAILDLSLNTDLVEANFAQNTISTIDVLSSTSLEQIIGYHNQLTALDVSGNLFLKIINMGVNLIANDIDLSNHTLLEEVYLNNNDLSLLNARNGNNASLINLQAGTNVDLHCITVDDIAYAENQLALNNWGKGVGSIYSLNCSVPTQVFVPDNNFEQALIDQGIDSNGVLDDYILLGEALGVQNLNVSGLNISDLTGIEAFENLANFNFNNNDVSTADFTANPDLYVLRGKNNALTSITVNNNAALQYLYLNNNSLNVLNVSALTNLVQIGFSQNTISKYRCFAKP